MTVVIFNTVKRVKNIRTDYILKRELEHLLAALMPENRLALEVSLATGLRITDVLSIRTQDLKQRMSVQELKTGKKRRIYLSTELLDRMIACSGKIYVFEGRLDYRKHRTRQAVWKDIKRVASIFRLKINLAPHSVRKVYAVEQFHKAGGDLKKVQRLMNHESETVTMLYAMADELSSRSNFIKNKDS